MKNQTSPSQKKRLISLDLLRRCLLLLLFGVSLHIGYRGHLVWELWNVLAQLSVTILIAYVIMRLPGRTKLLISIGLLLLSESLYRFKYKMLFLIHHTKRSLHE